MADQPPDPSAKVTMDPQFETFVSDYRDHCAQAATARKTGGQVKWFRPNEWAGDVFDYKDMGSPFSREASHEGYKLAVDPAKPGTVGDVMVATTVVDWMVSMERAFKMRHTLSRPRATALAAGRLAGHGSEMGPPTVRVLEYIRELLKRGRTGATQ